MSRFLRWLMMLTMAALVAGTGTWEEARAQVPQGKPRPPMPRPEMVPRRPDSRSLGDLNRRLIELDRLLSLKSVGRAESLLKSLEQHSVLERQLLSRRVRLAQLKGDHRQAVQICREAVVDLPLNSALWRSLATSYLAIDRPDSARQAVDMFLATSPSLRSAGMVSVELFQMAGRPRASLALIDSLRAALPEPHYMGRQKAICLLQLDRPDEAADEVVADLRYNPFNLSLVRNELLEFDPRLGERQAFLARLKARQDDAGSEVAEALFLAGLFLTRADAPQALAQVRPRLGQARSQLVVLQNAVSLGQELDLLEDRDQVQATVDYLLPLLEIMMGPENPDGGLRRRAADQLALVCEFALMHQVLGADPARAVQRFGDLLGQVRRINPTSEALYSSQISLAAYTRDTLRRPRQAAASLERMLLDLDLPTEGVALARLSLGECYLAAGDTARGRTVLTQLGRDPEFRQAAGHAHYLLARLDLAQGNFATARDRFAVVAMDNPAAPYANDALDMGLLISEEMDNPSGGPFILNLYARSVMDQLTAQPDSCRAALTRFVDEAGRRLDPEDKQFLLERGLLDLARAEAQAGRAEAAVNWLSRIITEHPDGRYPGLALVMRAELLENLGRHEEARNDLEQLLAQYPDYLFIDDVRDQLRNLP